MLDIGCWILDKRQKNPIRFRILFYCLLLFAFHLLFLSCLYAAFEFRETGARGVALSGAFHAQSFDATAPYWNPAGLRLVPQVELTSFYAQIFSIGDLSYLGTAVASPSPFGGVGIAYSQFGPSVYREQQIYFSHGFELADHVIAGYNLKGMFLKIEEYGSASTFGLDLSILARITENLQFGIVGKNVNHPSIGNSKEYLPYGFNAGAAFRPIEGLWLTGDFERIEPQAVSLKSGIEFMIAQYFTIRGGVRNSPAKFSCGFGAKAGIVRLDYAYQHSSSLSGSHEFSLSFKFGEPCEEIYQFEKESAEKEKEKKNKKTMSVSPSIPPVKISKKKLQGLINLSTATIEDLMLIERVGIVTAREIVKYRDTIGFKTVDDLLKVPKMRKNVFNSLKEHLCIQPVLDEKEQKEMSPNEKQSILIPEETVSHSEIVTEQSAPVSSEEEMKEEKIETNSSVPSAITLPDMKQEESAGEIEPQSNKPDINRMSIDDLSELGLNSIQIKNIMRVRKKRGGFKSFNELRNMPGMDAETFNKIKDRIDNNFP